MPGVGREFVSEAHFRRSNLTLNVPVWAATKRGFSPPSAAMAVLISNGLSESTQRALIPHLIFCSALMSGCSTTTYSSERSAEEVSHCIAGGWRTVGASGAEVPVALTRPEDYYYVEVVLVRDFPTFLPIPSIWAKVRPHSPIGSTTEYRRNFQIAHEKIDKVVATCQERR